jgi:hypothetical protein
MFRVACGLVAVLLVGSYSPAEDEGKPKLTGTWVREVEGFEIQIEFAKADQVKFTVMSGGNGVVATAKYTTDKDGQVKATITNVEEKGEFPASPPVGLEIQFKFKIDGKKAKLEDFEAENANEAKPIIEGEYEQKKKDD